MSTISDDFTKLNIALPAIVKEPPAADDWKRFGEQKVLRVVAGTNTLSKLQSSRANFVKSNLMLSKQITDGFNGSAQTLRYGLISSSLPFKDFYGQIFSSLDRDVEAISKQFKEATSALAQCASITTLAMGQIARSIAKDQRELLDGLRSAFRVPWTEFALNFSAEDDRRLANDAILAFEHSGFAFLSAFVSMKFILRVGRTNPQVRHAVLTKKMARITRSPEFNKLMEDMFASNTILAKRWPSVEEGLNAHRCGQYYNSISNLIREVEGIFTEIMIARGESTIYHGQPHPKRADGTLIRNKRKKIVSFHGMNDKLKHCNYLTDPILRDVADRYLNAYMRERNAIIHGHHHKFGTVKRSTQIVWVLYVLAYVFLLVSMIDELIRLEAVNPKDARTKAEIRLRDKKLNLTS